MKIPLSWIQRYVTFDDSVESLSDALTFAGIEVEAVEYIGGSLDGVIVGDIREVVPHPDADRLQLCTVFDGREEWPVVCGAPNARTGLKSAFAPEGTKLGNGMKIKKAKIRGQVSRGMLCAEDELGLSNDHEGILELPDDAVAGTPLSEILGEGDTVFEVEITPNRPDCLSLIGVAREIAAFYDTPFTLPSMEDPVDDERGESSPDVDIQAPAACPRYTARRLTQVQVGPSPEWMQRSLKAVGLRPINNVVDITNFVLLETGHPLHAFDADKLNGSIQVRYAQAGEPMTTLDDRSLKLRDTDLVIADASGPIALAGVMGGADSEIGVDTKHVVLEAASFEADGIRKTSRDLGLITDSSYRFERDVDPEGVVAASHRAAALLVETASAVQEGPLTDRYPAPRQPTHISCSLSRIRDLIGVNAEDSEILTALESIQCGVVSSEGDSFEIRVPTFRPDLTREVDLAEEFARLYGLSRIPVRAPRATVVPDANDRPYRQRETLRMLCAGAGFSEIMNYSLVSHKLLDGMNADDPKQRIELPNPISEDQSVLRTTLLPQMLDTLARNQAHQIDHARFFEIGRVYRRSSEQTLEEQHAAFGQYGSVPEQPGIGREALPDETFLRMKSRIAGFLERARIPEELIRMEPVDLGWTESGYGARFQVDGEPVALQGLLSRAMAEKLRFPSQVALTELNLKACARHIRQEAPQYRPFSRYPATRRDISFTVDRSIPHADIEKIIRDAAPNHLEKMDLFDIFESEKIGESNKAMAYALTFRRLDRSFTDEEVNNYQTAVRNALVNKLGVTLR